MLDDFGLQQLVLEPTRINHILDLILTPQPSLITNVTIVPGISDHDAVTFQLNAAVKRLTKVKRKVFLFHKANFEEIKTKLQKLAKDFIESNPLERTVEENWNLFKHYVFTVIDEFVPTKHIGGNKDLPWIYKTLKHKMKKGKGYTIMLNSPTIQVIGQHIRN